MNRLRAVPSALSPPDAIWLAASIVVLCASVLGCSTGESGAGEVDGGALVDAATGDIPVGDAALVDGLGADVASAETFGWDSGGAWPAPGALPAACEPWAKEFALPAIEDEASGVEISFSAKLQPVGVVERVEIRVQKPGSDDTDGQAKGPLVVVISPDAEILAINDKFDGGYGEVLVRLPVAGKYTLTATLGDGRAGWAEVIAYQTKLPVWEVELNYKDFQGLIATPNESSYIPIKLIVDGASRAGEVRLHGGTSREFPKKSLRINLPKDGALIDGARKHILRAEWNDKTMLRNRLAFDLIRRETWLPAPNAEFVHLRLNHAFYGVMSHVERIDSVYLDKRDRSPLGSLYEAAPHKEVASPGGNLTPLDSVEKYAAIYDKHGGPYSWSDLIELIEGTLQLPPAEFEANLDQHVRRDDVLLYIAVMAVIQNKDHVRKNYYLYRDPKAWDDRWEMLAWDLDLSYGHIWTEAGDVLDEQIFTQEPIDVGEQVSTHGYYNQLIDRVLMVPAWRSRFEEWLGTLEERALNVADLQARIDALVCVAQPDLLADWRKRSKNHEYIDRTGEIIAFAKARRTFIHSRRRGVAP